MAKKWERINRLSVICLKASHSKKAICGRHEPKIKLLTVWVKVLERGTWHNQRGKVWVIGSSREVLTTFPWSAPFFLLLGSSKQENTIQGSDEINWLTHPSSPAPPKESSCRAKVGTQLSHGLFDTNSSPGRLELVWRLKSSQPTSSLTFMCSVGSSPEYPTYHKLTYGRKGLF